MSLPCFLLASFSSSCAFLWNLSSQNQYDLGRGVILFSPSLFFPPPPRKKLCVGDSLVPLVFMMILSFLCFSSFFFFFQFVSCYDLSVTSCQSSWVDQDLMQRKRARPIMPPRNVCREHSFHRGAQMTFQTHVCGV